MAGGTWLSQNKVRPGAYINFKSVPRPNMVIGDRGIATMALPLNWGAEGDLIDLYSTDMLDGASLSKVGVTAFDEASEQSAKLLNLMLSGCYMAKIYRLNSGGNNAAVTIGGLTATAKYAGTFGNKINIAVTLNNSVYTVVTFVDGTSRDSQDVANASELVSNAFVTFSGDGALTVNAGAPLIGGTNGTYTAAAYADYFALAGLARWQTMAVPFDGAEVNAQAAAFAKMMRDDEGRYVQVVLDNYDAADFHGIINADAGFRRANDTVTSAEATAWVAGITAGASIIRSNTGRVIEGAVAVLNERTNSEIIDALKTGKFILSSNQRGQIVVEKDINSLYTFTPELGYEFSKNQVVRVLDEIGTSVSDVWEQSYKGKVANNDNGRMIFKSDIIGYMNSLQGIGAIRDFAGSDDVEVTRGNDIDAVLCNLWAKPVDSMERLFMTVNVEG